MRRRRRRKEKGEPEQYQLFATAQYIYRVFVTNMDEPIPELVWFYGQRGGAENLIKEANNDAGLAAHPSGRFVMNRNHFQLAMLAYNLNCWLMLFNREATETAVTTAAHDAGDGAAAIPVRGGQDLAPRRSNGLELQRPLRGEGNIQAVDDAPAGNCAPRPQLRPGDPGGPCIENRAGASAHTEQGGAATSTGENKAHREPGEDRIRVEDPPSRGVIPKPQTRKAEERCSKHAERRNEILCIEFYARPIATTKRGIYGA